MFTGIVEGRGTVADIRTEDSAIRLTVKVPDELQSGPESDSSRAARNQPQIIDSVQPGDSVAINGCCLTVVEIDGPRWDFQAGAETLAKTNLGQLKIGDPVNLERSLPVDGRFGGHFVQGHVDGVGTVDAIEHDGEWVNIWFKVDEHLAMQMVPKGSVTVDGVSLTVVEVETNRFSVALIPHTLEITTLGVRKEGHAVNIETDILGKYVLKMIQATNLQGFGPQAGDTIFDDGSFDETNEE